VVAAAVVVGDTVVVVGALVRGHALHTAPHSVHRQDSNGGHSGMVGE
jgi:hypothetical protein